MGERPKCPVTQSSLADLSQMSLSSPFECDIQQSTTLRLCDASPTCLVTPRAVRASHCPQIPPADISPDLPYRAPVCLLAFSSVCVAASQGSLGQPHLDVQASAILLPLPATTSRCKHHGSPTPIMCSGKGALQPSVASAVNTGSSRHLPTLHAGE